MVKICPQGILGLLIMNPLSDFHNSKWRIQDGDRKTEKKHDDMVKICIQGVLGSLMMNPLSDFHNSK